MNEIDIIGLLAEWWWVLLFIMRPGLLNLAGGYFAGVWFAHTKPETAQGILNSIGEFLQRLQS